MITRIRMSRGLAGWLCSLLALVAIVGVASASKGDQLPEFRECVEICKQKNCFTEEPTVVPFNLRLLFWDCPSECDYTCQQIVTSARLAQSSPPLADPIVQYHGKWPFTRLLGVQEVFSVLFSLLNLLAHQQGLREVREHIPATYSLRKFYILFGYFGTASWIFSMIFHTRDFVLTERLDYFAAGASVLYGLYLAPIRVFRLDRRSSKPVIGSLTIPAILRLWTLLCISLYIAHVSYLTFVRWDYTYNMAANVVAGAVQNLLWSWFSISSYVKVKRLWAAWPGLIVMWITLAMSLELLDFPPLWGLIDAHSLWHAGTVLPTIWWYSFLIKDARRDLQSQRLKA